MPEFRPTNEQASILSHPVGRHARVLAGPGTGKSVTLVQLLDGLLQSPEKPRIKLLTFTRAATAELAKKVLEHEVDAAERPSTVHSFAIGVLLRNPGAGGLPEPVRVADDWEYETIVQPGLSRRSGIPSRTLKKLVKEMAANWQSLTEERDPSIDASARARFLGAWGEHRTTWGYTLLQELPNALLMALRNHPDLVGIDYTVLIVDEYQDLNACDLEVIKRIAARGCAVIGAGDDDQSIYKFRKAAPEGIRRFQDDYPGAANYPLSISQRCGQKILEWATHIIEGDPDRPRDRVRLRCAERAPDGEVALLAFSGHVAEARGIAQLVGGLIDKEGLAPTDILILLRGDHNKAFSNPIKEELERLGIAYADPDAVKRMLAEAPNRRLLALCRLSDNRTDSLAWASLLHLHGGIGPAFVDYVYQLARESGVGFGAALLQGYEMSFADGPTAPSRGAKLVVEESLKWIAAHPVPEEQPEAGWGHWLIEVAGEDPNIRPTEELRVLLVAIDEGSEPEQDLSRYVGHIGPVGKDIAQTQSQGVRIMTMSAAKGLTVRATIVAALEEGVMPHQGGERSEERRLLYVAMTRSREYLFGTWSRRRQGPTARSGRASTDRRTCSQFFEGGPIESEDGSAFLEGRFS